MKITTELLCVAFTLAAALCACEQPVAGNDPDTGNNGKVDPPPVVVPREDFDATRTPHKNVTFFTFTATWCGPCYTWKNFLKPVETEFEDTLINLNFYTSSTGDNRGGSHPAVASDVTDDFITQFGEGGIFRVNNFPTAIAEISEYVGRYGLVPMYTDAMESYAEWIEYPAKAAIRVDSAIKNGRVEAAVTIGAAVADSYRIAVLLVEDNVVCVQSGYGEGYNHTDVVRQKATDSVFGDELGALAVGETATKNYGFDIATGYIPENLSIVAYVLSMNDAEKWAISNSMKAPANGFTDFKYKKQ